MPLSQANIDDKTPLGANVVADGWTHLPHMGAQCGGCVLGGLIQRLERSRTRPSGSSRTARASGPASSPSAGDGAEYKFYVDGTGSEGYKRDPYARELSLDPPFPNSNCVVRKPDGYPWHDQGFRMPDVQRPGRLPVPYRRLLCGTTVAGNDARPKRPRHVPRRGRPARISGRSWRQCDRAAAGHRVPHRDERGVQRHRLFLARDGVHARARRRPRRG